MWLKVGMPPQNALITCKQIVLIMYEAPIRADSAFVSPSLSRETIKDQSAQILLDMYGCTTQYKLWPNDSPKQSNSATQHGHEKIIVRDSVILMTIANIF